MSDILQTADALANVESYALEQLLKEGRGAYDRAFLEDYYQRNPEARQRISQVAAGQLHEQLLAEDAGLAKLAEDEVGSAEAGYNRAVASWDKALDRVEYQHQSARISARVSEVTSPAEVAQWVNRATSREQLEALRDNFPAIMKRFDTPQQRQEVHGYQVAIEGRLDALRPSSYTDAQSRLEWAYAGAQRIAEARKQANEKTGGALDVQQGKSIFSASPEGGVVWSADAIAAAQTIYGRSSGDMFGG